MPKGYPNIPRDKKPGKRISVYLRGESLATAKQIDNLSAFLQLALSQASAIMAFDIIQREKKLPKLKPPTDEAVNRFNDDHPLDPLTAKRLGKQKQWRNTPTSPPTHDLW